MKQSLSLYETLAVGLMLFSIFFGAGNLIFPPALGQAAGTNLLPAIGGFLVTGIGLPLMGVLAIGLAGGSYTEMIADRIHPKFIVCLMVTLNLAIGPLFAIPRTGAVAFEVGVRSFVGDAHIGIAQFIYTLLFFVVTYCLALNPSKIVDRIGKILTPILLFFMALLFLYTFISPLGSFGNPVGAYAVDPFLKGFKEGYLTMDLLAFIIIGTIVINSIQAKGVTEKYALGKLCIIAGIISATLMSIVYISLAYLGASSIAVLGQLDNGGLILSNVAKLYFGDAGSLILAIIISCACLTTSCGLASSCACYFSDLSRGRIQYQRVLLFIVLFSLGAANFGLTPLIALSIPFLVALYPVVIVLVLLSLASPLFGARRRVFQCSLALTLAFSIFDGLNVAGVQIAAINALFSAYLPFYSENLGWAVPALAGAIFGYILSARESEAVC